MSVLVTAGLLWVSVRTEMAQHIKIVRTAGFLIGAVAAQIMLGIFSVFPPVLLGIQGLNRAGVVTLHRGSGRADYGYGVDNHIELRGKRLTELLFPPDVRITARK